MSLMWTVITCDKVANSVAVKVMVCSYVVYHSSVADFVRMLAYGLVYCAAALP